MIILTLSHNIFLTREERYALHKGNAIPVLGVSVPVWVKKGVTPKPAEELFCRYVLINPGKIGITSADDGWTIAIPPIANNSWRKKKSNEEWRKMTEEEKCIWYERHTQPSANQLLDLAEGGSNGYLAFAHQTIMKKLPMFHFIQIKPMECLLNSLV